MFRKRTVVLLVLALALLFAPAVAQQEEPETPRPMVDEKYGTASNIMGKNPDDLVAILEDTEASVFAKAKACQRLAVIGSTSAVPALEALLIDPRLSHYARFALEPIGDEEADLALQRALNKAEGALLIGIINSIGRRGNVDALPALAKLLHDSDQKVARSAAEAMRRIRPAF